MLSRSERRRVKEMQGERYLLPDNPMSRRILSLLNDDPRPEWVNAFLTMPVDGTEMIDVFGETTTEMIYNVEDHVLNQAENSVFVLFGRAEVIQRLSDKAATATIIRNWLKHGLNAPLAVIARESDVEAPRASKVRTEWGDEIRALLQEAAVLGLTGRDLYMACDPSLPVPKRLIERLRELRAARGVKGGMLRREFEQWLKSSWEEYKRRSQKHWSDEWPPSWFVRQITEDSEAEQ